jgi:hypothetical protein
MHNLFFQFGDDKRLIRTDGQLQPARVVPLDTKQNLTSAMPLNDGPEPADVFGRLDFSAELDTPVDVCPEQSAFPSLQPSWTFPVDSGDDDRFAPDPPSFSFFPS